MDHAEAHELLADLALEPGRLRALDADESPETEALRAHVAACATCAAEVAAWRRTWTAFGEARAAETAADRELFRSPASVRAQVTTAITTIDPGEPVESQARVVAARRWSGPRGLTWLAAAAALVLALGAGSIAWVRTTELDHARAEAADLAAVAATMDRVLADPVHWVTPLTTADGAPGGTLVWSNSEVVVVSAALPAPEPGQAYRCWVERNGARTPVGSMEFTAGTAYWAGSMAGWADLLVPGARFGVSLVRVPGGDGTPVLIGSI